MGARYSLKTELVRDPQEARMVLAICVGFAAFIWLTLTSARRRERVEIARTTGMIRSPLYRAQMALQVTLLALMIWAGYAQKGGGWLPLFLLGALVANVIAVLLVRRSLKWRYPV
jgi:hypothetical protein